MNVYEFGETFSNGNTEPSLRYKEGVETRYRLSRSDKGIVQTTNIQKYGSENYSGMQNQGNGLQSRGCGFESYNPCQSNRFQKE